jgi:hypothetical protein
MPSFLSFAQRSPRFGGQRNPIPTDSAAWAAIRAVLQNDFSFYDIKEIIGLAGIDVMSLAHLEQKAGGGAS